MSDINVNAFRPSWDNDHDLDQDRLSRYAYPKMETVMRTVIEVCKRTDHETTGDVTPKARFRLATIQPNLKGSFTMIKSRFEIQPPLHPLMTSGHSRTNVFRSGLAVGLILGAWHLMWSTLVATGLAQPVADFIFWMHFIKPVYLVEPFDAYRAIVLVSLTFAIGFVIGSVGAAIWNSVARSS